MKKSALVLAMVAGLGLSGCYTTGSPEGVLGSAYKALTKNDVKKFPKFLTGEAKAQYGSLKGMVELQDRLAHYTGIQASDVTLVATQNNSYGKATLRTYSAHIMGNDGATVTSVLTAEVLCNVFYTYDDQPGLGMPYYGPINSYNPNAPGYYPQNPSNPPLILYEVEHEDCRISKLD